MNKNVLVPCLKKGEDEQNQMLQYAGYSMILITRMVYNATFNTSTKCGQGLWA